MALDLKKATLIVFLFEAAIVDALLYAYHRSNASAIDVGSEKLADSSLEFVAVLFRHGDRSPLFKYKTDPHVTAFPGETGELTKKGKQHMYKKGQIFRRLYNYFLSDLYLDSEILIKTTHMSRTYMSAAMVLAGMYPPVGYQKWSDSETVWQPIPIYNDSPDHSLLLGQRGICPSFDSIFRKLTSQMTYDTNITVPLLTYLSEKCGQPINYPDLFELYDLFLCQISDGLQLPEWITPHHMETIRSLVKKKENSEMIFGNPRVQHFLVGPLLKEIALDFETRSNNSNHYTRKIHLYSGHDISSGTIMAFLGNAFRMPDFGASLHFHLYLDKTVGYNMKVFYYDRWDDEKEKEVLIPTCGNPCKIQDFVKLITDRFSEDWEEACHKVEN